MDVAGVPLVQVLLSTYNGAVFLPEQLDSLLVQDYPNLRILIRDDGSTDGTLDLLLKYEQLPQVKVLRGENQGIVRSFFELMAQADSNAAYLAFCDQDDVWLPGKVSEAVALLREQVPEEIPGLYCSRYTVVDQNLHVLAEGEIPRRGPSFLNALVQNIAPGCSMVINRAAVDLLARSVPGPVVPVHDWWFYLVIAGLGRVVYDPRSFLLYRQHGSNSIGVETSVLRTWSRRLRRFVKQSGLRVVTCQAVELQRIYGDKLPSGEADILAGFLQKPNGFWKRMLYAVRSPVYRQKRIDDLILRLLLVVNRV